MFHSYVCLPEGIKYQDPSSKIIQDSLTSPMVSVREPQLRTTANSNKMATKMAINEDGITLKICNGTWNAGTVPSGKVSGWDVMFRMKCYWIGLLKCSQCPVLVKIELPVTGIPSSS